MSILVSMDVFPEYVPYFAPKIYIEDRTRSVQEGILLLFKPELSGVTVSH